MNSFILLICLTLQGTLALSDIEERLKRLENEVVKLQEHVHHQDVLIDHLNKALIGQNGHSRVSNFTKRSFLQSSPAAFTAIMDHVILSQPPNTSIVFNKIITNEGHSYDAQTGKFTAPQDGVYLFSYSMHVNRDTQSFLQLVHNGVQVVGSMTESTEDYHDTQGGNTAVISLFAGDQVWVEVFHDKNDRLEGKYGGTSFTGAWIL